MSVKQIVEISDHSGDGHDRLHQQYKDPLPSLSVPSIGPDLVTGWRGLLNALIVPAQEFEDIANKMLNERGISTGAGVNLDRIGQIVGIDRGGRDDAGYSPLIVGQIAANNSDTTARDLLVIATILIGPSLRDLVIKENFPAKATIDYLAELQFTVDASNKDLTTQIDLGGGSPALPVVLTEGQYFPHELRDLISQLVTAAWRTATGNPNLPLLGVDFTATRQFQFNFDTYTGGLAEPAILWGTAAPLYGYSDGQLISTTAALGDPIAGPDVDDEALASALDSAKAAGVEIVPESVELGNYFGFFGDIESIGWGVLQTPVITIGGGTYSTLIP